MKELAQYLLQNIIIDFDGAVTTDSVRAFLRKDDSADARILLQRIIEDNGIDELLLALADCLTMNLGTGISPDTLVEHLASYSDS